MRRISLVFVPVILFAGVTMALAQTGTAAGGAGGMNAGAAGAHRGGVTGGSPSIGTSGKPGTTAPSNALQKPPEPGCPGSTLPATNSAMKPAC
jgi:hypothetical protein